MNINDSESKTPQKWKHPSEVMKLQKLKLKKKALQARINSADISKPNTSKNSVDNEFLNAGKRKNPFIINNDNKRNKVDSADFEESSDQTLFKLLHFTSPQKSKGKENITNFSNLFNKSEILEEKPEVKVIGEKWIPIDWALKTKVRLLSSKPFIWNSKLKISEEASGITSFARCLDTKINASSLDASPNAKFHRCCLYWQQPNFPWLSLFPRVEGKASKAGVSIASTSSIRESLHTAFTDSFRSLFQLIRTKQCPYFYVCSNMYTVLFRAAGICGISEMQALVTPTTRGFRNMLKQEEIEFTMPLKKKRISDSDYETLDLVNSVGKQEENDEDDDHPVEDWMESMGINSEEIKKIQNMQAKVTQRNECEVDNSEQSLVLIEGVEVQAFYSCLINCKSITLTTGPYAGIPPTLLSPVAFNGASLKALSVRESKVHVDAEDYYSLDLTGPILPHTIHNLCMIHPKETSMTATFSNFSPTIPFSKFVNNKKDKEELEASSTVFSEENLSDCGLVPNILRHFCSDIPQHISNVECLKYTAETNSYAWS